MKNLFKISMLAAFAMAFAACSNDATEDVLPANPEVGTKTITVTLDTEMTRTVLNDGRTGLMWENGDSFGYFANGTNAATNTEVTYDGAETYTLNVPNDATEVYAYYPHYSTNTSAESVSLGMGTQEQEKGGVFNGYNYPMVAKFTIGNATLKFKPIASAIAFNVYNTTKDYAGDETVTSIKVAVPDSKISGRHAYNLVEGAYVDADWYGYDNTTVTLRNPVAVGTAKPGNTQTADNQIYLMLHKGSYTGATITVTTNKDAYTFSGANLDCTKDMLAMNLNLSKGSQASEATLADGDYVIMAKTADGYYALSSEADGARLDAVAVEYDSGAATFITDNAAITWTFSQNEDKTYTIASDSKYISLTKDDNAASTADTGLNLTIVNSTEETGTYKISTKNTADATISTERYIALNTGKSYFAFYKSTSNQIDNLYIVKVTEDTRKQLDQPNVTATAEGNTVTVTWDAVDNATNYTVTFNGSETVTDQLSATFSELLYNTEYTVSVVANPENATTHKASEPKTKTVSTGKAQSGSISAIYSTGFESSDSFTTGTNYQGEVWSGKEGKQWKTYYGTPSTSKKINGDASMAMRLFSNGNLGYTQTEFDLANVTTVTYKAMVSNAALKLDTYYSTDGGSNWIVVDSGKTLTTIATEYTFTVSETGEYATVRIKFAVSASSTKPSNSNYQLTIDDVTVYGVAN